MRLGQFINSIIHICRAKHTNTFLGILRHLKWQVRRLTNSFPVLLRFSDSQLYVDRANGVGALVNNLGVYDYNNMNLIKLLMGHTSGVFFDVGANIGSYTLIASEARGSVVSFEPHPKSFAILQRNMEINNRNNVTLLNAAVSDHSGTLDLTDSSELALNKVAERDRKPADVIKVEATTLDKTCHKLRLTPNIVKIDVEGYEAKVLDGFCEGIKTVDIVLIEKGQRDEIKHHRALKQFVGPFCFDFDSHTFSAYTQRIKEDSIFVHRDAISKLKSNGLVFP